MEEPTPIPPRFYNYDTGKPFESCLICNVNLMEPPVQYMIEKNIRRYPEMDHEDIIYEYAICLQCAQKQQEFISSESQEKIMDYLQQAFTNRVNREQEVPENNICSIYSTPIEDHHEYTIQGVFRGGEIDPMLPFLTLGQQALEDLQELLSQKTRDGMDDFLNTHFSGPPEFRELLRERKTVLI